MSPSKSYRQRKYLGALKRRRDYLRELIARGVDVETWDKAEANALDWAIEELEGGDG